MRIKIDKADQLFSIYIRMRDQRCVRCGSPVQFSEINGKPISHEASHYFGRGKETTRFDPENVDCLCFGCHKYWGSDGKEDYREFKIQQLGKKGFENLRIRSEMRGNRDREASYLYAKELLKRLDEKD